MGGQRGPLKQNFLKIKLIESKWKCNVSKFMGHS